MRRREDRGARAASFTLRREVLARYVGQPPSALAFVRRCEMCGATDHGRPRLAESPADELEFSVSHAGGLAIVAVASRHAVGADVECERNPARWARILPFARHQDDDRHLTARELWTAKEAALKALGAGLALAMQDVTIAQGRATVTVASRRRALHIAWFRPTRAHLAAIAMPERLPVRRQRWPAGTNAPSGDRTAVGPVRARYLPRAQLGDAAP